MKGKRITTLEELYQAARNRRAVFSPGGTMSWIKPLPAGFIINLQGGQILNLMRAGLFIYEGAKRPIKGESK